ncbi:CAP domain-containing protein [Flavitalea flava]
MAINNLSIMTMPRLTSFFCYGLSFFLLFSFTRKAAPPNPVLPPALTAAELSFYRPAGMENSILYYINRHRQSRGQKVLTLNKVESDVAAQHSRDMASGRVEFGHGGMSSRRQQINKRLGPVSAIGENVAYGQTSAKEVVDAWLQSPGHRRNIEGNFILTGIGLARDRRGLLYYTQIFTR